MTLSNYNFKPEREESKIGDINDNLNKDVNSIEDLIFEGL